MRPLVDLAGRVAAEALEAQRRHVGHAGHLHRRGDHGAQVHRLAEA